MCVHRVMSQNPAMWAARQAGQRTDGYGQYDLTSPRSSPVAPGYLSGTKQLAVSHVLCVFACVRACVRACACVRVCVCVYVCMCVMSLNY